MNISLRKRAEATRTESGGCAAPEDVRAVRSSLGIDIVQPWLAAYRIALFDAIDSRCPAGIRILAGRPTGSAAVTASERDAAFPVTNVRTIHVGPLRFTPRVLVESVRSRDRHLVLSGNLRQVETIPALLLARLAGRHAALWVQGLGRTRRRPIGLLRHVAFKLAHSVIVYSRHGAAELAQFCAPEKIHVVANTTGRPAPQPGDNPTHVHGGVAFVGRLDARKGVDEIVSAIAQVSARGVDLTLSIVGDGPQRRALESLVRRLHIDNRVIFHGAINSWAELRGVLSAADLVVAHRASGLAVVDAFAAGRGVIVSKDVANGPECLSVQHGVNGTVLHAPGIAPLVEELMYLFTNPHHLDTLGRGASATYRSTLTVDHAADAFVAAVAGSEIGDDLGGEGATRTG